MTWTNFSANARKNTISLKEVKNLCTCLKHALLINHFLAICKATTDYMKIPHFKVFSMTQIYKSKFIILSLCLARLFAPIQLLAVSPILHNANVIYMTKCLCFFKVVT